MSIVSTTARYSAAAAPASAASAEAATEVAAPPVLAERRRMEEKKTEEGQGQEGQGCRKNSRARRVGLLQHGEAATSACPSVCRRPSRCSWKSQELTVQQQQQQQQQQQEQQQQEQGSTIPGRRRSSTQRRGGVPFPADKRGVSEEAARVPRTRAGGPPGRPRRQGGHGGWDDGRERRMGTPKTSLFLFTNAIGIVREVVPRSCGLGMFSCNAAAARRRGQRGARPVRANKEERYLFAAPPRRPQPPPVARP
jgi:hypothetical protein